MHIVYVCREYPPALRMGGIASYLKEISVAMVQRGHEVTVIAASDDTRNEYEENIDGVRVIRLKGGDFVLPSIESSFTLLKKFRGIYRFGSYRRRIKKAISKLHNVNVIEVAEYGAEGYYLRDEGIPITMRLHTPTLLDRETGGKKQFTLPWAHEYWIGLKEEKMMPWFHNVTSCSKSLLEWCEKNVEDFPKEGKVIYNPLNISSWQDDTTPDYEENTILYAGTVAETKGVGDLVDAVAQLNADGLNVKLKIAGKIGSYGESLKESCKMKGFRWCKFLGHITRDELKHHYRKSKISCFPSWWEAMGIVCIEAMAIGNIVVGSENGGMSEVITDGKDGFLITPRDRHDIVETLKRGLEMSRDEVINLRAKAHKTIEEKFSTQIIAKQFENYYESIRR